MTSPHASQPDSLTILANRLREHPGSRVTHRTTEAAAGGEYQFLALDLLRSIEAHQSTPPFRATEDATPTPAPIPVPQRPPGAWAVWTHSSSTEEPQMLATSAEHAAILAAVAGEGFYVTYWPYGTEFPDALALFRQEGAQ